MTVRSIRAKTVVVAITVAIATSAIAFVSALVYYERRLDGLPADVRDQVERQVLTNTPDDFDGIAELLVATALATVLGASLGIALTWRHARVVTTVSAAARHLRAGDLTARAETARRRWPDEADRLVDDFNHMADQLDSLERERLTTSARIAHELRTPVSVLRARLQANLDGVIEPSAAETRLLLDQTLVLERLIEDLRTLSLHAAGRLAIERRSVDLVQLARETVASLQLLDDRTIRYDGPDRSVAEVDPERVRQALANLVLNAQRHTAPDTSITVRVREAGTSVTVEVEDASTRAAPQPDPSQGTGLGLGVVDAVATAHGGTFTARDTPHGRIGAITFPTGAPHPRDPGA